MGLPTLRTHRLPVQRGWRLQRRLAKRRTTDSQGRSVAGMVQPIRPHDPRLRHRRLLTQQMIIVRGVRQVCNAKITFSRELQEALESRTRMLGSHTFVAMRQQQGEP